MYTYPNQGVRNRSTSGLCANIPNINLSPHVESGLGPLPNSPRPFSRGGLDPLTEYLVVVDDHPLSGLNANQMVVHENP